MYVVVVVPVLCIATDNPNLPSWQSGSWNDYARLLLTTKPAAAFLPLLLYSATCVMLLVFAPERFLKRSVVRFGVYTGTLLALHFWVVFGLALFDPGTIIGSLAGLMIFSLLVVAVSWGVGKLIVIIVRTYGRTLIRPAIALVVIGIAVDVALLLRFGSPMLIFFGYIVSLLCGTTWVLLACGTMTFLLVRDSMAERFRFSLAQLLGMFAWVAAYCSAWRTSVDWMLEAYAKLPVEPPQDCYICTAAARGHSRLVRAGEHVGADGKVLRVNDQMRYLKAAELMLAAISPRGHRVCRRTYDLVGPMLAATLIHPVLADAAYLSLKPAEWTSRAILGLLPPSSGETIRSLYKSDVRHDG